MRFYKYHGSYDFSSFSFDPISFDDECDWLIWRRAIGNDWPKVGFVPTKKKRLQLCDFPPGCFDFPVFSERAVTIMAPFLDGKAEVLPLECRYGIYFAINVLDIIPCVDVDRSTIEMIGESRMIRKFAFNRNVLDHHLFLSKEQPYVDVFVSQEFVEFATSHGLTGLAPTYVDTVNEDGTPHVEPVVERKIPWGREGMSWHHVMPLQFTDSEAALALMEKYQIDPNSDDNMMLLPTKLHELETFYCEEAIVWMTEVLQAAEAKALGEGKSWGETRDAIIRALSGIGQGFLDGVFPWEEGR